MTPTKKRTKFRKWTAEEDATLQNWVSRKGPKLWTLCSKLFSERSATQCRERWKNSLDPSIKKGDWSEKEDLELFFAIRKHMFSWKKVSMELEGRTRISCRNRYYNSIKNICPGGYSGIFRDLVVAGRVSNLSKWAIL